MPLHLLPSLPVCVSAVSHNGAVLFARVAWTASSLHLLVLSKPDTATCFSSRRRLWMIINSEKPASRD